MRESTVEDSAGKEELTHLRAQIENCLQALEQACMEHDVERLQELDGQVREALVALSNANVPNAAAQALLEKVAASYRTLKLSAETSREAISAELKQLKRDQKAANVYLNASFKE